MTGERDGAFKFLRERLERVGGHVIGKNAGRQPAGGEALENLPDEEDDDGGESRDARETPFSAVQEKDRDQQKGLIRRKGRQRHGDGRGD